MKLALCGTNLDTSSFLDENLSLQLAPNPSSDWIYIKNDSEDLKNEFITIIDVGGKVVFSRVLNNEGGISIRELEEGFYVLKTRFGIVKLIINR